MNKNHSHKKSNESSSNALLKGSNISGELSKRTLQREACHFQKFGHGIRKIGWKSYKILTEKDSIAAGAKGVMQATTRPSYMASLKNENWVM